VTIHAAISSYRRVLGLITPLLAGFLASLHPTMPYARSLAVFIAAGLFLLGIAKKSGRS
jgi:hypothetical protein